METNQRCLPTLSLMTLAVVVMGMIQACSQPMQPEAPSNEIELVLRYKYNEDTGAFTYTVKDRDGKDAEKIEVTDKDDNPLGVLAKKTKEGRLHVVDGVSVTVFASKNSPGCVTTCMGGTCQRVCN